MPFVQANFFRSFRFRVMAGLMVVVLSTMVLTTALVRAILTPRVSAEFNSRIYDETVDTAREIQGLFPNGIPANLAMHRRFPAFVSVLESRGNLRWFIRAYQNDALLFETESALGVPRPTPGQEFALHEGKDYRWYETTLRSASGQPSAELVLQVGRSTERLLRELNLLDVTLFLRGFLVIAITPIAGYFFAKQVTGPLADISATANRLQPQHLSERLPIRGTDDELDRVSATINRMLDRIADYIERNRSFVANAAHELRSPLAALQSTAEVALNRVRSPEEYANLLSDMIDEVGQLSAMVNRLLILAQGDDGRLAPQPGHTARLDKVVREAVDMFHAVAESLGVALSIVELHPATLAGDESNLRHLVRNLIDNAIKFSSPGGSVEVTLKIAGDSAILTVADHGIGIAESDLPRLFERFFRGDRSRHRETGRTGTGLGLSICQSVVQAMGGEIRVESEVGKGSTFTVRLPLHSA